MNKNSVLLICMSCLMLVISSVAVADSLSTIPGKPAAPDFVLKDMNGDVYTLRHYQGRPAIISFWATWCPPCRAELPSMNRAWKELEKENIAMVAVNVGEDVDTVFEFTGDYPIDFDLLLDQDGSVTNRWPVKGVPTTFVIDAEGRLVYQAVGGREWDDDGLLDLVRALK